MSFDHTSLWVAILVGLFFVLNLLGFLLYALSHPSDDIWQQIWGYAESEPPKLITAGLVLPLLVFLIEGNFNVTESIRTNRSERRQKTFDEHNTRRLHTRDVSGRLWVDLCKLSDEVTYWDGKKDLADVLKRASGLAVEGEDTVLSWYITLPCLRQGSPDVGDRNIEGFFLLFINSLLSCIASVAQLMRLSSTTDEEREQLQMSLGVIKDGLNLLSHYRFLRILEDAASLEALRDPFADPDPDVTQDSLRSSIHGQFDELRDWSQSIRTKLNEEPLWPVEKGAELDSLRSSFQDLLGWLSAGGNLAADPTRWVEVQNAMQAVSIESRIRGFQIAHSPQWIKEFAALLAEALVFGELMARSNKLAEP